jgi:catalase-peroxidase
MVPDDHVEGKMNKPFMFTTDVTVIKDPDYLPIARNFYENPDELAYAFARAWYKLLYRDAGPVQRLLGPDVSEPQLWQDPIPDCNHELIDQEDIVNLKHQILNSASSVASLVRTAFVSASTFRGTDFRGGANGARIRL